MGVPVRPALLALASLAACAPAPARCPEASAAAAKEPPPPAAPPRGAAPAAAPAPGPRLSITIAPIVTAAPSDAVPPEAAVGVEIAAAGLDPAALSQWTISSSSAEAVRDVTASDDSGAIAIELAAAPPALRVRLARPARGAVRVHYVARAAPLSAATSPAVEADPDRLRASGEALLALPDGLGDRAVPVSLRVKAAGLGANGGEGRGAATSFGVGGDREVVASARALREAFYLAGPIGTAVFDAPEGHDEAAWLGFTAFDPRPVAADLAAFRTAVRQMFPAAGAGPLTLLFIPDARPPGEFVAARRGASVAVLLGVSEPWSAPLRIATATEIIHGWIGAALWVGPTDAGHEAEAYWFTEGVARGLARDLLFRFGLISPADLLDEMHGLAAVAATSPHRARDNRDLAAHARDPGVLPLLVARGALYAARTDALLRRKAAATARAPGAAAGSVPGSASGSPPAPAAGSAPAPAPAAGSAPAASLEDVLRALLVEARARRGPLPASAWIDALTAALGPAEAAAFRDHIERGVPAVLPEGALGPCFRGARRRYEPFDLGFDLAATHAAPARALAGLRPGGPAARAGAREGDLLAQIEVTQGRADVPVKIALTRAGKSVAITYRPAGPAAEGQGWARVGGVADEACAR